MRLRIFMLGLIAFPVSAMAEIQTLEEAWALAYQHDPGLQAQRAKLRATDEQISQALSNWRPSVDAEADAGKNHQTIADHGLFSGSSTLTPRDESITITQPIFRGFRTVGSVHSGKASIKAGRAALEDAEQQLLLDTGKAYLDVMQGQDIVRYNRRNEADLQEQLNATRDRFRVGELKKTDVNQAESRLKIATVARLQAETDLANSRVTFARLVGEMPGTLVPPRLALEQPKTKEEAVSLAEIKNPAVIAADYTREAADADVTIAEGSLLPEVSLVGSATRSVDQNPTIPQRQDSLSLIAKMTIPLYRSGTDYSKSRAAKQTVTERREEFEDARNKARESAGNAWQTLITSRDVITGDKEALDATDKALYGVKEEAKVGTRTTLDVLNAEQELLNARVSVAKAEHDEGLAVLQVRAAVGTLTAEALQLPVELYDPTVNYKKARNRWAGLDIAD
jgi:TolC family type I secretion outer membrane protein